MKKKFLAYLLTLTMLFNIAMPYGAYAADLQLNDIAGVVAGSETDAETDNDATDDVAADTPTADVPTTDDEQEAAAGETAADESAAADDDFAESDGKEVADEPVAEEEAVDEEAAEEEAVDEEADIVGDVAGILENFTGYALNEGIMPVAEGTTVTFSSLHEMQINSLKLYTFTDGVKGDTDLLAGNTVENRVYAPVSVAAGTYWVEGYDSNGGYNGGLTIEVKDGVANSFAVTRIYSMGVESTYTLPDGTTQPFKYGVDYKIDVKLTDSAGKAREKVEIGKDGGNGNLTCFCMQGDTVAATFTAIGDIAATYPKAETVSVTMSDSLAKTISARLLQAYKITVKAPAGSTIAAGRLCRYYTYEFSDPIDVIDNENGVQASFWVSNAHGYQYGDSEKHFVRVQHPDGVTSWKFGCWNETGTVVEVTAEDLNIGGKYTPKTVTKDFSDNIYDIGNIYLSVNAAGSLQLNKGASKELNVWRNWQAKDTYWPTMIALPDVHYQVLKVDDDGNIVEDNENSVISIIENPNHSSQATISAQNDGTAIVLVTYDAVSHPDAMAKVATEPVTFSAIWPENTGVFVVRVGGAALPNSMTLPNIKTGKTMTLDSELDVLFYTGDDGAEYSFTPMMYGSSVSVARSKIVDGKMVFDKFTTEGVTNESGKITITGLTEGRHVIKVFNGVRASYQVVTAHKAGYTITHKDKSLVTAENPAKAGETVTVQYSGLYNPMEHLAGVYNNAPGIYMGDKYGNIVTNDVSILGGYYDFSSNSRNQKLEVTIPSYHDEDTYVLDGSLHLVGFGEHKGGHRSRSYSPQDALGGNSPNSDEILSILPHTVIPTAPAQVTPVKLIFKDNNGKEYTKADLTTITIKGSTGRVYELEDDGTLNGVIDKYTYEVTGRGVKFASGSFNVSGRENETVAIDLIVSSPDAWDGSTKTEPKQTDGVYQISNGEELAWFVDKSTGGEAVTGVLTADIDLAEYVWIDKKSGTESATILDGKGHKVYGLNAVKGLFSVLGYGSKISNLTVQGTITPNGNAAGGIAAQITGTTIENCCNEAVFLSNSGKIGGIVGEVTNAYFGAAKDSLSTITNCVNKGSITSTGVNYQYFGGIAGCAYQVYLTIENCYNTADITAGTKLGGILGEGLGVSAEKPVVVKNCYNTGKATMGVVGNLGANATVESCVYLDTAADADAYGKPVTADELQGFAPADSNFKLLCAGGNPVLPWQVNGAKVHSHNTDGVVTANTCTSNGYTTYKCTECGKDYKTDLTYALGHEVSDKVVEDHPAYTMNECVRYSDCHEKLRNWKNDNFKYMTISDSDLSNLALTMGDAAQWTYNAQTQRFEAGKNATANAAAEFTFTVDKTAVLAFNYGYVKTWGSYDDTMTVLLTKQGVEEPKLSETLQDDNIDKNFMGVLDAGTYTLKLEYVYVPVSYFGGILSGNQEYGYFGGVELIAYENAADAENSMAFYNEAKVVIEQIDALPAVGKLALTDKDAVNAARKAYDALSDGAKEYVSNLSVLVAAEAQIKQLQKEADDSAAESKGMKVTFRLIGSTLAEEDVDLSEGLAGFHGATYQTWIKTTTYTIEKGDVVADVFERALKDHNLTYIGGRNWVSAITAPEALGGYTLYERQNGASSGWMYTVNGIHVNKTMDDWVLKNGDAIIWHYINDYNYEDDQWYGGSEGNSSTFQLWLKAPDVDPNGSSGGGGAGGGAAVSTEVNPVIKVDANGEAKVSLSNGEVKNIVAEAKEAGADEILVQPKLDSEANKVTVNIPTIAAKTIANDANADLRVKSDIADIKIGKDDLAKLGTNGNLTVAAAAKDGAVVITVTADGKNIDLNDSTVTIAKANAGVKDVLVLVNADGTEQVIKRSVAGINGVTAPIGGNCTVKLVSKNVTFNDTAKHWAKEAAEFVAAREIFNGTGVKTFAPNDKMDRAMVATVLWRLQNEPAPKAAGKFNDAVADWAKQAVIWAAEQNIVNGDENGSFNGENAVTRQELAAMMYRYAKATDMDTTATAKLDKFTDSAKVADWATDAMKWMVGGGLMKGNDDNTINPNGTATRAEVATVIMRLLSK